MKQNNSPWLTQLQKDRKPVLLETDTVTDVVIVGGGIAGVTTLYYVLKHTDKQIILLEGNKIAHGATGHNAGQVVAEFERPLASLIKEHGMHQAIDGYRMMEQSWELLGEIIADTGMDISFREFIGYGGYCEIEQLIGDLETELIKSNHGLVSFPVLVSRESGWMKLIPNEYREICTEVGQDQVLQFLGVKETGYCAALPEKKATVNSALFTEQLALWCLKQFPDRVRIFEFSHVHGIELESRCPLVITNQAKISCNEIVLCTNGFENFYIRDQAGMDIDTKFHHLVQGKVGYMTAYLTNEKLEPMANFFYEQGTIRSENTFLADPYFYVTRRKFDGSETPEHLMAIGGPEVHLVEREIYFRDFDVSEKFRDDAVAFAERQFDMTAFDQKFFWHGLMGYTRTGVRVVVREPIDERLLYNLGCNGVGILPSIMGARKIARHIAGETVSETIFDPKR